MFCFMRFAESLFRGFHPSIASLTDFRSFAIDFHSCLNLSSLVSLQRSTTLEEPLGGIAGRVPAIVTAFRVGERGGILGESTYSI